ncbi:hypothetical protein ANCCAN_17358 [Ancylostoma caninum]|uniref:Uncharacterized protein n=1 Tax=Ancylostoma caninum TaxID=29170 RepID=A0A368FX41_ANCCA|nr:hypothetical protein ANCCAN_17358 [Ancylostoma caninum]
MFFIVNVNPDNAFFSCSTIECDVARPPRLLASSQDGILADKRLAHEPSFSSHVYRPTVELFNGVQLNTPTLPQQSLFQTLHKRTSFNHNE